MFNKIIGNAINIVVVAGMMVVSFALASFVILTVYEIVK